jgi:hypothetical protein
MVKQFISVLIALKFAICHIINSNFYFANFKMKIIDPLRKLRNVACVCVCILSLSTRDTGACCASHHIIGNAAAKSVGNSSCECHRILLA